MHRLRLRCAGICLQQLLPPVRLHHQQYASQEFGPPRNAGHCVGQLQQLPSLPGYAKLRCQKHIPLGRDGHAHDGSPVAPSWHPHHTHQAIHSAHTDTTVVCPVSTAFMADQGNMVVDMLTEVLGFAVDYLRSAPGPRYFRASNAQPMWRL